MSHVTVKKLLKIGEPFQAGILQRTATVHTSLNTTTNIQMMFQSTILLNFHQWETE
jgi:hypothetical protein